MPAVVSGPSGDSDQGDDLRTHMLLARGASVLSPSVSAQLLSYGPGSDLCLK